MKEWKLWDLVTLPWCGKKYEIYKIGMTKSCTEYLLWDFAHEYPWWFGWWQLEEWKETRLIWVMIEDDWK